jgi:hypothetical protein
MPITSRVFVKASIVYFVLGAVLGALMLINRSIPLGAWVAYMRISHVQFLIVGWLTQLIMAVGWWLFPPLKIGLRSDSILPVRRGQTQRGSEPLFWAALVGLNVGILLRAAFEPLYSWSKVGFFGFLAGISSLFLLAAVIAFLANMWGRVRELRQKD